MKNYKVIIGSPVDYNELTADVVINDVYVLRVQKEQGRNKMIVEFFEEIENTKIYYDSLVEALLEAKDLLLK